MTKSKQESNVCIDCSVKLGKGLVDGVNKGAFLIHVTPATNSMAWLCESCYLEWSLYGLTHTKSIKCTVMEGRLKNCKSCLKLAELKRSLKISKQYKGRGKR